MVERFSELDGRIAVGSCPTSEADIVALVATHGITAVVSLQSDDDLASRGLQWSMLWQIYLRHGVHASRVPVRDFDKRDLLAHLDAAVAAIDTHINAGRKVYVHCTAGLNRSPSAVMAWLAQARGFSVMGAAEWVAERHEAQPYMDVLKKWAKRAGVPYKD